tara:strand:+ start:151 stop:696 length:546 start_codon:yes stop_codon:yes gene_type:complete
MPKSVSNPIKKSVSNPIKKSMSSPIKHNPIPPTLLIVVSIIALIIITFFLVLHYAMYTWTEELEKTGCECSNLWHRNIIHWLAIVLVIIIIINIVILAFTYGKEQNPYMIVYNFITVLMFITYIVIILDYITKLKNLECECSESWKREYGYIGIIAYISLLGLILILPLIFIIILAIKNRI